MVCLYMHIRFIRKINCVTMRIHAYLPGPGVIDRGEGPGGGVRMGHHHRVVGVRGQTTLARIID